MFCTPHTRGRSRVVSAENGRHDYDRQTEHEHYLPSLFSPVAAVAGPWENIVDRNIDASYFFVSTVAAPALVAVATCYSRNGLICEKFVSPYAFGGRTLLSRIHGHLWSHMHL